MTDDKALWDAIQKNPGEDAPKLALADWYGEHGRPDMLHALKWCVRRGRWPRVTPKGKTAIWYGTHRVNNNDLIRVDEVHALPAPVVAGLPASRHRNAGTGYRFSSLHEAILHLAAALDKLRHAYEVPA